MMTRFNQAIEPRTAMFVAKWLETSSLDRIETHWNSLDTSQWIVSEHVFERSEVC